MMGESRGDIKSDVTKCFFIQLEPVSMGLDVLWGGSLAKQESGHEDASLNNAVTSACQEQTFHLVFEGAETISIKGGDNDTIGKFVGVDRHDDLE
jgi:hypothetical protein